MFNFLLAATKNHYFDPAVLSGQLLISAIVIIGTAILACTFAYFLKRDAMRKVAAVSFAAVLIFCIVALILSAVETFGEQAAEETAQAYQLMFALSTIISLVAGVGIMMLAKKVAGKHYKKVAIIVAVLLVAITITFFTLSIIESDGDISGEGFLAGQSTTYLAITLAAIILMGLVLLTIRSGGKSSTIEIVYAAVCIAVAFALSYIRVFKLPQGGSITLASLVPLALYSYKFGWRKGVMCCFIYGIMQSLQDPWIVHPVQYFLDYPLAFAGIGLVGIFRDRWKLRPQFSASLGLLVGVTLRYFCHAMSGAIFFGTFGADAGFGAWAWGFVYNAFVYADAAIAIVALFFLMSSKEINRLLIKPEEKSAATTASKVLATQGVAAADGFVSSQAEDTVQFEDAASGNTKYAKAPKNDAPISAWIVSSDENDNA